MSIKSVFIHHSTAYPWRGTCIIVPSLAYRTICIVLHLQQSFLNKQCNTFLLILHFLFIHMFIYDMLHPYTLVRPKNTRGLCSPHHGVISPNTFTSAAPRTYSTICISSESCLESIVGFARLPCFGTLHSVVLAKVALGEPLRLCPS